MTVTGGGADLIVVADSILAMNHSSEPIRDRALVVHDGAVVDVVSTDRIIEFRGARTEMREYPGATIMPGFVDPHAHTEVACVAQYGVVDVRVPTCRSVGDVLQRLRQHRDTARNGWLVAQGNLFFDRKLSDGRLPTREELDAVSTDLAIIVRAGGHLSILNSRALQLSGIDDDYRAREHSITGKPVVQRDHDGTPTGVVMEMDNVIPFPRPPSDELPGALRAGIADLFTRYGVTTIGEISETVPGLEALRDAVRAGDIPVRVHAYLWAPGTLSLGDATDPATLDRLMGTADARFSVRGVKVFSDGGFSAGQAAITGEYLHRPGSCGHIAMSRDELVNGYAATAQAGLQLAVHANGDRAQREVCEAVIEARALHGPHPGVRIEHAGNYVPDYRGLTDAWRRAGIIPVPQPIFIRNFGEFVPDYVGEDAWQQQFPFRSLLADGWPISGSSDVWIGSDESQTNPFRSIAATLDRRTFHGHVLGQDQAITPWQALWMHTAAGARALALDGVVGSLAPGRRADWIVLDHNPLDTLASELEDISVLEVVVDGTPVAR